MIPMFAVVEWPSAIVAIVLLVIIAVIMLVGMFRYTFDEVLKLWAALGTLVGLITGTMATYFFTNQAHEAQTAQLKAEKQELVAKQVATAAEKDKLTVSLAMAKEKEQRAREQAIAMTTQSPTVIVNPFHPILLNSEVMASISPDNQKWLEDYRGRIEAAKADARPKPADPKPPQESTKAAEAKPK